MKFNELLERYNELLEEKETPIKTGKGKALQLERIKKYFELDITGTGKGTNYTITKEYTPEEIEFNMLKDCYKDIIKGIIAGKLLSKDSTIIMTNGELLVFLGFIKEDFMYTKRNIDHVEEACKADMFETVEIDCFIDYTYMILKKTMNEILRQLVKANEIMITDIYVLCKYNEDKSGFSQKELDSKNKEDEILLGYIMQAKKYALYKTCYDVSVTALNKKSYNEYVNDKINELSNGKYDFYFVRKCISRNRPALKKREAKAMELINSKTVERLKANEMIEQLTYSDLFIDELIDYSKEVSTIADRIREYKERMNRYRG